MEHAYPTVRLRPKAEARAIRHGFPWVYSDELVTDRRTQGLAPGALAVLEDAERRPLGLVTVNVASRIIARMLDRDPDAVIGRDWFAHRLAPALALRSRLYQAPFYRLVHAESDGLPGVVVDRFGDVAVVQPNAAWAEAHLPDLVADGHQERLGPRAGAGRVARGDGGGAWRRPRRPGAGADERRDLHGRCDGRAEDGAVL